MMRYESIAEIYSENEKIRSVFIETLKGVTDKEAAVLPNGEKWSIQQIVEHVSLVDAGTSRICAKLLEKSRTDGRPSDGSFSLSSEFGQRSAEIRDMKVEAPERVQPTGDVTIAEALDQMAANKKLLDFMRPDLEQFDLGSAKFPHPYFGDLTAAEWLVMLGGHEARHTNQIQRHLESLRQ